MCTRARITLEAGYHSARREFTSYPTGIVEFMFECADVGKESFRRHRQSVAGCRVSRESRRSGRHHVDRHVSTVTIPPLVGDDLTHGRHRCTLDHVRAEFGTNSDRINILDELDQAIALLRTAVDPICAIWISGSFISGKPDPSDIDVVFVIEDAVLDAAKAADPVNVQLLNRFADGRGLKPLGLRVDAYTLGWRVNPELGPRDQQDHNYLRDRGHWDDFWQRKRSGMNPRVRQDALPLRGYLEVMLNGYT